MSTLTPTARVILGMLALGARTGYDIKRAIDLSTRFFWGASYGQIYPELHRLAERGLVRATPVTRKEAGSARRTRSPRRGSQRYALGSATSASLLFEIRNEGPEALLRWPLGREDVIAT